MLQILLRPPSRPPSLQLSKAEIDRALSLLAPVRAVAQPKFVGFDRIPDSRPLLFVGNHTVWGLLDIPFLFAELYERKGIFLRGLGDHVHFQVPLWRDLLWKLGAVDGTREACGALMEAGEAILVFPGGGREVAKRRGERYRLLWKERLGFARLAVQHACTIVPFAAVGIEDALDVVLDSSDLLRTPLGKALKRMGFRVDLVPPIVKGIGPTPLPRPERLYFEVRDAVDPRSYASSPDDEQGVRALRDRVKQEVEAGIASLHVARAVDPKRRLLPRLAGPLRRRARMR
jgi:1-acyl-sn-glycerol-3-phosphate acyltransferase